MNNEKPKEYVLAVNYPSGGKLRFVGKIGQIYTMTMFVFDQDFSEIIIKPNEPAPVEERNM